MAIKYYTVVFRDGGSPKTGLSPTLDVFVNLSTSGSLAAPTVTELAGGLYRFGINWDVAPYVGVDQIALRADSEDTGMADGDRYVFGIIERYDDTDTYAVAATVQGLVDAMVLGDWTIENNQLQIYKENGTPVKVFDLFDIDGNPTSTSATSRVGV